jgi:plasmid replication initiation protein
MSDGKKTINRRTFLRQTTNAVVGAVGLGTTARSYARILGANDRVSLGHVGVGNRGRGLQLILAHLKDLLNVETSAVCDLWKVHRERAVAMAEKT